MSIRICTYEDPYGLSKEQYWPEIKNAFHLCSSQTLVNAMRSIYKECPSLKFTTVEHYLDFLFEEWRSDDIMIRQRSALDLKIRAATSINGVKINDLNRNSLMLNQEDILESLRILFALKVNPRDLDVQSMSSEQKVLHGFYQELVELDQKPYWFKTELSVRDINQAITDTIEDSIAWYEEHNKEYSEQEIDQSVIVIQGIHQFSPEILKMIEVLSNAGKKVILLFHYQKAYSKMFETWVNVYNGFNTEIEYSDKSYLIGSNRYTTFKYAKDLNGILNGESKQISSDKFEVVEYDNLTEFVNDVADQFDSAKIQSLNTKREPLSFMSEKIYAPDATKANELLKVIFPEQFGERQFLDYPLGNFFLSIVQMWSPENKCLEVKDINMIKECLSADIIMESEKGVLINSFNRVEKILGQCKTIQEMIDLLEKHRDDLDYFVRCNPEKYKDLKRQIYNYISVQEINELIEGLRMLQEIAEEFCEDFNANYASFKEFYTSLHTYLSTEVLTRDLEIGFKDIVKRVLERLEEVKDTDANASFQCLRDTMKLYLKQKPNPMQSAHWIIKNFEQLDGDILSVLSDGTNKTLHLAMVSDDTMIAEQNDYPWPLNRQFFECSKKKHDWKIDVYMESRNEYVNFKRYSLFYALEFNRMNLKISYIKHMNTSNREISSDLYYGLKALNPDVIQNNKKLAVTGNVTNDLALSSNLSELIKKNYDFEDIQRYKKCPKKFLLETIVESETIYRDAFQIDMYHKILIFRDVVDKFRNERFAYEMESTLKSIVVSSADKYRSSFEIFTKSAEIDMYRWVMKKATKFFKKIESNKVPEDEIEFYLKIQKVFLIDCDFDQYKKLVEELMSRKDEEISELLELRLFEGFCKNPDSYCAKCSKKHICRPGYNPRSDK